MKVERREITVRDLWSQRNLIYINPSWQRGPAWQPPRQVLLIDSILRQMDFPKVYLRRLPAGAPHHFDVVDGQQRLRAIFLFKEDKLTLSSSEPLPSISGMTIEGKVFSALPKTLRDRFEDFTITIAEIVSANRGEVNDLFARLQMGVALNPAELRNAMLSPMRDVVDATATAHPFFVNSRILDRRYKRQDYAAHAFSIAAYGASRDLKAPELKRMYGEFAHAPIVQLHDLNTKVEKALSIISELDPKLAFRIRDKWIFVDLFWIVLQEQEAKRRVHVATLAEQFSSFDELRREYRSHAEDLLETRASASVKVRNRRLYEYIQGFEKQGATRKSLEIRNRALRSFLF
jgi:hypothetical protein